MKFGVKCPACKKAVTVDGSRRVVCNQCGCPFSVKVHETLPHQKEMFGKIPARAYVTPLESKARMDARAEGAR
jgi:predicted amidophosphoribosyltransferase